MGMTTIGLNVDQQSSINECVAQVTKLTGGTLDILVNNAYVLFSLLVFTSSSSILLLDYPSFGYILFSVF